MRRLGVLVITAATAAGCSKGLRYDDAAPASGADAPRGHDAPSADGAGGSIDAPGGSIDAPGGSIDARTGITDAHVTTADAQGSGADAGPIGVITGGPCASGAAGATALRVRWADGGGTAYPVYEAFGLPDHSREKVGAYGYTIPFSASFVDPYLGDGGVQLDGSDFIDLEISTAGLAAIDQATLAIYGRSFDVSTDGSFNWQTFDGDGYGETPTDFVSNVPPYRWYAADMTAEIAPGDSGALIRIKAGPSSGVLVVNRIELCVTAR